MTADAGDGVFERERPRLVGLAYRILGSRAEAEDAVQDAWLRWERTGPCSVDDPAAWLTTVTSRIALDRLSSAQRRRETYVGPWLPEPVVTTAVPSESSDPADVVELQESLTLGFLVVLEQLAPVERVVFLMADVFKVPFADIAATVDRSPAACRQIATRARQRLHADRPRFRPTDDQTWAAAAAFVRAAQAGDLDGLVAVLADDAVLVSDGGPDRHAARRPVVGADRVSRFVANLTVRFAEMSFEPALVNGEPGGVMRRPDGTIDTVVAVHVEGAHVSRIHVILNPDKISDVGGSSPLR